MMLWVVAKAFLEVLLGVFQWCCGYTKGIVTLPHSTHFSYVLLLSQTFTC